MKTNKSLLFSIIYVIIITLWIITKEQIQIHHIIVWYLSISFLSWFLIKLFYYDLAYQDINELENKIKNNELFYPTYYAISNFKLKYKWNELDVEDRVDLIEKHIKYKFISKTLPIFWLVYLVVYFLSIILYVLENLLKYLGKRFIKLFLRKTL